jgi:hypothetical protein
VTLPLETLTFTAPHPPRCGPAIISPTGAINGPSLVQGVVDRSAAPAFDVFLDEGVPLPGCRRVTLAGSRFMGRATGKLSGPLAQTSLDVSKCPMPVHPGGPRSGLAVVDPFLVTKGGQRFDVAVVKEPATRDHMMIQMRKPRHQ